MQQRYFFLILGLLLSLNSWAQVPQTISGTVQTEAGMPLPGATIFFKGTYNGGSTNEEGQFQIKADFSKGPQVLSISFVGYETQVLTLAQPDNALVVTLRPSAVLDQVVVAASRVEESIGQVPVTVEKLNQRQVEQITTPDLVAGLGRFKGIDVSSSSMLTTSFSTRGFNSSRSERVIQLSDYMDTQVPSLSSYFGNLLGAPVLDVASVEIVHGPASALYGANAFNGVLLTNSKDPFKDPGLTVRLRGGNRDLLDGQLRYATKIGERVAFKISGGATTATDFLATNMDATSALIEPANNPAGSNLGYDAVSRYGDVGTTFAAAPTTAPGAVYAGPLLANKTLFLPGFSESDLVAGDKKTHSYKVAPSLAVLITNSIKATVDYKYTNATTSYQSASRYRFVDGGAHQGRVQLEGRNWFVRGFTTHDFSGKSDPQQDGSYNLGFLGAFLQAQQAIAVDANGNARYDASGAPILQVDASGKPVSYGARYIGTYASRYNTAYATNGQNADLAAQTARQEAGKLAPLLQPGTQAFNDARNKIIHDQTPGQGARLFIRSVLNEGSGQYTFNNSIANLTVGAAYRQYLLGSDGSLFEDTKGGDRIKNYEYGAYAQATKTLLDDHLKLAAAGRVDQFQNFGTAFSPRASVVYSLGADKLQNFRASFSRAFRAPTQNDQYIRLDVGRAFLLGNVRSGFDGYTLNVLKGASPADAANLYHADKLRLEEVNSYEVGYRAELFKKFYIDVDYFYSTYNNFIATQNFVGRLDGTRPAPAELATTNAPGSNVRVIQIAANVDQRVQSQGAGITLSYAFAPGLTVNGNYSYNDLITKDFKAGTQSFFNTPKNKFNLGLDGQLLNRALSYNLNYRWVDSFLYESTFATGTVPTAQTVDAQLGYTLKSLHTTLQAGVTNLFDTANLQVYGAPSYGRIGYFGLLFDIK
ncbi:TonB-dependent receptor [Hymenobacter negativus]|uniref:Carboxypeptidase-like regulatory domain-containing protein n=1 Tax=Hymenobacter negativus TaxID=2795026 RepID=A0ABS0Q892_9BACT|nr:TonB-dependent receptor [Hymenobacter negativus]MBH8558790.1 carboxypeptidase-like regulatory domain-containing protein [Hymenobacter negativus]